jgi:hypothetical protein
VSLTHCACVVKELPIAGYSVVKDPAYSRERFQQKLVFVAAASAHITRVGGPAWPSSLDFGATGSQACLAVARGCGRRLVENTGLEPVTSWLQTRRSPS